MFHLLILLNLIWWAPAETPSTYTFAFYRIDNKADIIVNDSLVFTSGEVDRNPDLEGNITFNITQYLTSGKDEVIIRLYNGFAPYTEEQKDKHWEIEYSLIKNAKEIDLMWDEGDDYQTGLVFEEKYYL